MNEISIILVAAGSSSRMGQPKQLLAWNQSTLLHSMASIACNAGIGPVLVVLGCEENRCRATMKSLPVKTIVNEHWQEGMGSSIACGVKMLTALYPAISATIIMQCDQIAVDEHLLKQLAHTHQSTKADATLCRYGEIIGSPGIFNRSTFGKLSKLGGHHGAKSIWQQAESKAVQEFLFGCHDLDTIEQYQFHRDRDSSANGYQPTMG